MPPFREDFKLTYAVSTPDRKNWTKSPNKIRYTPDSEGHVTEKSNINWFEAIRENKGNGDICTYIYPRYSYRELSKEESDLIISEQVTPFRKVPGLYNHEKSYLELILGGKEYAIWMDHVYLSDNGTAFYNVPTISTGRHIIYYQLPYISLYIQAPVPIRKHEKLVWLVKPHIKDEWLCNRICVRN